MSDILKIKLCNLNLRNPLILASGTAGFGQELSALYPLEKLGGISSKGLTLHERQGNNGNRLWFTASGLMNSVGLQNPGIKHFLQHDLSRLKTQQCSIIVNLGGSDEEEYVSGAELLAQVDDIDMIELNISCPNVKHGGMACSMDNNIAYSVVKNVKKVCRDKPLMVKLSPNAPSIVDLALAVAEAGADVVSLVNTFSALAIDIKKRKPVFDNIYAGLSGPCIKPIALRMVRDVFKAVQIPVVGMGGIMSYMDVLEFIMAGASAVQVGTANLANPTAVLQIITDLELWCLENNIKNIMDLRGIV